MRFFAAKNSIDSFKGSVRDWLDDYMESILLGRSAFNYDGERKAFSAAFAAIDDKLGETAFVKFRNDQPIGGLAPAYFEAVAIACHKKLSLLKAKSRESLKKSFVRMVQSAEFRKVTGPGANAKSKLTERIKLATSAIMSA